MGCRVKSKVGYPVIMRVIDCRVTFANADQRVKSKVGYLLTTRHLFLVTHYLTLST